MLGVIAEISTILAKNKVSIFVVSTFDTDYILIKSDKKDLAIKALLENGYSFS